MTPKIDIIREWITALESGHYIQGQGYLRKGNEYCCLGVLCDITKGQTGGRWEQRGTDEDEGVPVYHFIVGGQMNHEVLPITIQDVVGLGPEGDTWLNGREFPYYEDDEEYEYNDVTSLVEINDRDGSSFKDIVIALKRLVAEVEAA